jgi:hypothetical protein
MGISDSWRKAFEDMNLCGFLSHEDIMGGSINSGPPITGWFIIYIGRSENPWII